MRGQCRLRTGWRDLVEAGDNACQVEATLDSAVLTALRQAFPVALDADSFALAGAVRCGSLDRGMMTLRQRRLM